MYLLDQFMIDIKEIIYDYIIISNITVIVNYYLNATKVVVTVKNTEIMNINTDV